MVFWKNVMVILFQRKTKTQRRRKCNTISGRISYLALNFRPNNIENIEILSISTLIMTSLAKLLTARTLG